MTNKTPLDNPDKLPLRECSDDFIVTIVKSEDERRDYFATDDNIDGEWVHDDDDEVYVNAVYRIKPKKLTVTELHDDVFRMSTFTVCAEATPNDYVDGYISAIARILELIKKTEGYES